MMVRSKARRVGLSSVRALLAVAVTSLPVLGAEPAECARYHELKAAGHQAEAERMLNVCHDKKRQARARAASAAPAPAPAAPTPAPARASAPTSRPSSAPALVATSSKTPATNPAWATDLPTVARVRSSIKGSDAADTALRQQSAFNTMRELIGTLSGFGTWPPAAASRLQEYDRVAPHPATLPPNPYDQNLGFQRELLTKLVSPPTALAYEASAHFQRLEEPERKEQQAEALQTKKRAKEERQQVAASAAIEAAAPAWIKSDVAKARAAHVDSAFGLQFGRPLDLPPCDLSDDALQRMFVSALTTPGGPRGAPQSCAGDLAGQAMGSGLLSMVSGLQPLGGDHRTIPGGQLVGVGLATDKCPPWSGCSLNASVASGVLVGLTVAAGDDVKSMKQAVAELTRKYGRPGSQHIQCTYATHSTAYASNGEMVSVPTGSRTVQGDSLSWSNVPGIYVSYVPYTGTDCGAWLYVELASVHTFAVGAAAHAEATAPTL